MVTVHLPRSLVTLFTDPPPRRLEVKAATLAELIGQLDGAWPGMRDRLVEAGPRIREHINVFIDGERERDLGVPITDDAVVHIIPAVAGGAANDGQAGPEDRQRRSSASPPTVYVID